MRFDSEKRFSYNNRQYHTLERILLHIYQLDFVFPYLI